MSPLTSSGQRNCASWASQPQKSVTLLSCPGGRSTKSTRTCGGTGPKKKTLLCYFSFVPANPPFPSFAPLFLSVCVLHPKLCVYFFVYSHIFVPYNSSSSRITLRYMITKVFILYYCVFPSDFRHGQLDIGPAQH